MSPLHFVLGIVLIIIITAVAFEVKRTKDKKKCLVKNLAIGLPVIVGLFLFGPLFMISPIKLGHTVIHESTATIIYPNKLAAEANHFAEAIQEAETKITDIYGQVQPTSYLLVNSFFDMLRFGGSALEKAGGSSSFAGIFIRSHRIDAGIITHELSHRHLQEVTGRLTPYFPRWFDEGLATYLGNTGYMAKYTQESVIKEALEQGTYQPNLDYWNGFRGYLRWLLSDCKKRPTQVYAQSYFLVRYLAEAYGENKIRELVGHCRATRPFEKAFKDTYGFSTAQFHQNFLENSRWGQP